MEKIDPKLLKDNFFEAIGKEWMLVTAGTLGHFNTMTASWGCIGWLWNKPVAIIFVRPERYTHLFVEGNDCLTLAFLGHGEQARKAYNTCGSLSGRDCDKADKTGLRPVDTPGGNVTFDQARLTLECRKLYKDTIKPKCFIDHGIDRWYGDKQGGYHDTYILEITAAYVASRHGTPGGEYHCEWTVAQGYGD